MEALERLESFDTLPAGSLGTIAAAKGEGLFYEFGGSSANRITGRNGTGFALQNNATGGGALRVGIAVPATTTKLIGLGFFWPGGQEGVIAGFGRVGESFDEIMALLSASADGTLHYRVGTVFNSTSRLASTRQLVAGSWNFIVVKVTFHDSAGAVDFWINGAAAGSVDSVDTANGTAAACGQIRLNRVTSGNMGNTAGFAFDDLYVNDAEFTGFQNCSMFTGFPDSDITDEWDKSAGSDSFAMVDENPADEDTTHIRSATLGEQAVHGHDFSELPATATVLSAQVYPRAKLEEAGATAIKVVQTLAAETPIVGGSLSLTTDYSYVIQAIAGKPGGGAYTVGELQSGAGFGVELA